MEEGIEEVAVQTFSNWQSYWAGRYQKQGEQFVGKAGEDYRLQTSRLEDLLRQKFTPECFYENAVDFGCGWGRMLPFLANYCGHIWAADIVPAMLEQARLQGLNITTWCSAWPYKFPAKDGQIDLLFSAFVLQHIVDEGIFAVVTAELKRILRPGARILLIDNAQDKAKHVKARGPEVLAGLLGMREGWKAVKVTVNRRPNDHWLIDGIRS